MTLSKVPWIDSHVLYVENLNGGHKQKAGTYCMNRLPNIIDDENEHCFYLQLINKQIFIKIR